MGRGWGDPAMLWGSGGAVSCGGAVGLGAMGFWAGGLGGLWGLATGGGWEVWGCGCCGVWGGSCGAGRSGGVGLGGGHCKLGGAGDYWGALGRGRTLHELPSPRPLSSPAPFAGDPRRPPPPPRSGRRGRAHTAPVRARARADVAQTRAPPPRGGPRACLPPLCNGVEARPPQPPPAAIGRAGRDARPKPPPIGGSRRSGGGSSCLRRAAGAWPGTPVTRRGPRPRHGPPGGGAPRRAPRVATWRGVARPHPPGQSTQGGVRIGQLRRRGGPMETRWRGGTLKLLPLPGSGNQ